MKKIKNNSLVKIEFWDHSVNSGIDNKPFLCTVIGNIYDQDKVHYKVWYWIVNAEGVESANSECCTVVKSTVTKITLLEEKRELIGPSARY